MLIFKKLIRFDMPSLQNFSKLLKDENLFINLSQLETGGVKAFLIKENA